MLDDEERQRWREEAAGALETARLAEAGGRHNWACFLAERSAQLAVKGVLHGVGAAPWGHDVVALGRLLSTAMEVVLPDELAAALLALSRHYIPARYPDASPGGSPGDRFVAADAARALAQAELVLQVTDGLWLQLRAADADSESTDEG